MTIFRRTEFREAHLELAWKASERGELVSGGALANPVDGAMLLFKGNFTRGGGEVCQGGSLCDEWGCKAMVCARMNDRCRRGCSDTHQAEVADRDQENRE